MGKILVAYFSASGVTKHAAEEVAKVAGADLYEIKPEVPYTKEDLDWMNKKSRSSIEMEDKSTRPAIIKDNLDVSKYDHIYIGFPIWWYVAPTIINTFLEAYDFSNKTITLFATSGSSGLGNTVNELKVSAPNALIKEGLLLNNLTTQKVKELLALWLFIGLFWYNNGKETSLWIKQ